MISKRTIRHKRVRAKIFGTNERPRFSVYRSNRHLFLQLIDDDKGKTILGVSDKHIKMKKGQKKSDFAYEAGKLLAKLAKEKKITRAVFDRGGYKYHGRVKKAAEGARESGLKL
ncbi:50S ribosomal protein L18 [Candidatus Giovannonibacteria bacterium RIFCSPLOWO2_12_FULL_44_25]|uniref:Large ribosomal subunit protein uL18 n=3 Tax=Parcubacteria group TaxID=1794811 RepID=A0A837IGQ0_9BACT|nr:MAG: 50S ribosomal protein L18, large subunit ribosomal protein L18 [Parcubacteria group bacterium GW2011_GWC1_44_10]KKT60167.1 MAG: 50S ribosomal protein L18 [Candidatus Giovannonibacteria bacterium GW2011_GWA1_44_25]KKU12374.1 MAG: 50S ribosomal protein L18 [Candidatus Azambacteria bacterium GW2011_GWC2_45_7b]KKU30014.1 MAG: 50S ribosomal protein L18 [Candidatus Giovannonibacteria bacterium GW2011_GWB1_46_20]OGF49371.1 MAG: 50S ribosomal protein L18 [Candidatus Giovannonibacteria bacterium